MLAHAFIASRVDYCNSILYQAAAVHLRPLQLVLNAAARLVVRIKKRKRDTITHLFVTIFTGFWCDNVYTLRFVYWCTSVFTSSPPRTSRRWSVRFRRSLHVAICAQGPGQGDCMTCCATDKNSWLQSMKLFSRSSVTVSVEVCRQKLRHH